MILFSVIHTQHEEDGNINNQQDLGHRHLFQFPGPDISDIQIDIIVDSFLNKKLALLVQCATTSVRSSVLAAPYFQHGGVLPSYSLLTTNLPISDAQHFFTCGSYNRNYQQQNSQRKGVELGKIKLNSHTARKF